MSSFCPVKSFRVAVSEIRHILETSTFSLFHNNFDPPAPFGIQGVHYTQNLPKKWLPHVMKLLVEKGPFTQMFQKNIRLRINDYYFDAKCAGPNLCPRFSSPNFRLVWSKEVKSTLDSGHNKCNLYRVRSDSISCNEEPNGRLFSERNHPKVRENV